MSEKEAAYIIDEEQERKLILKEYRRLLKKAGGPTLSKYDKKQIRVAFEFASDAHSEARRKSGEPYILHPLSVAQIVSDMGLGTTSIVCALLHDVVEDTEITLENIQHHFDSKVAEIIDGLTKISAVFDFRSSFQAENFRKLLLTLSRDVRVILIKLADRLHNMRTLDSMSRRNQLKIASETMYLYAPLAHRLGLYFIKSELEDLSLKYTEIERYQSISANLERYKRIRSRYVNEMIKPIKKELEKQHFKFRIAGRTKSVYSISNKMKNKGVGFDEVYDLFALRIVVDAEPAMEKAACWRIYSIVTDYYQPNPQRLRDWISIPKANGYESLHTTVMGPNGHWVEVQIRTERMDEIAEKGYAAHWKYKEGSEDSGLDDWLRKIREILKSPESNALDFLNDFKLNLYSKEIYIFTPKGDLKILPKEATTIDFAYEIHTEVGNHCIGAKVNKKLVPLNYKLSNGDQVEIITSKKQTPNEDWLSFAVTGRARSRIKQKLKAARREIALDGKDILQRKFKTLKIEFSDSNILELVNYYNLTSFTDLFYQIANKKINLKQLKALRNGNRIEVPKPEQKEENKIADTIRETKKQSDELLIFGQSANTINYQFAKCCNPIPGDDVFGFITVNGAIKIHRTNCPNAIQMNSKYGYRVVKTRWSSEEKIAFLTGLKITGLDDLGVMNKITNVISGTLRINIQSISVDTVEGLFEGIIKIFVKDKSQLDILINKLKKMKGINSVNRIELEEE